MYILFRNIDDRKAKSDADLTHLIANQLTTIDRQQQ